MRRIGLWVCLAGLWTLPAIAQELQLRPPTIGISACSPDQTRACAGPPRRPLERDLSCDACSDATMSIAVTATAPARPIECALGEMPLGPDMPGCTPPPVDAVPRL